MARELSIDYAGVNIERTVGLVTFTLDGIPDFGLFVTAEDRQDQGELGMYPIGIPKPQPRTVAFYIKGRVDPSITDEAEIRRHLTAGWTALRTMFTPRVGYNALGVETVDTAGLPVRRELLCKPLEAPSFRMVFEADRTTPGARPAGYLRYLVRLEATWPWWRGEERTINIDTALATTYALAPSAAAQKSSGWRLEVATVTNSPTVTGITVEFDSGGYSLIEPWSEPHVPYSVFDWWHTNPQDWYSYIWNGAPGAPEVTMWSSLQPATGSNGGRIGLDCTSVAIAAIGGTFTGVLYWYDWFEDYA